jgi:ABC-type multidrug transport system fused ATPase/permease subunit
MDSFMDWFWLMVWWFFFFMYLMILFRILADLFRDHTLNGWWKALWVVALIVVPFVSALIYIIARGRGMAERQRQDMSQAKAETDSYIRTVAGTDTSAADQISQAKELLDAGVIDETEFAALKAKALA